MEADRCVKKGAVSRLAVFKIHLIILNVMRCCRRIRNILK